MVCCTRAATVDVEVDQSEDWSSHDIIARVFIPNSQFLEGARLNSLEASGVQIVSREKILLRLKKNICYDMSSRR